MVVLIIIGVCFGVILGYSVGKDAGKTEFERKIIHEVFTSKEYSNEVFDAFKKSINRIKVK